MSRIIFGSCSSQHYNDQPLWPVIQQRNASAFVWGGDAVYADDRMEWNGLRRRRLDADPEYLRQLFREQQEYPGYKELLQSNISIFGTVDDHDYGRDNGDKTFPWRRENGIEFVRFLGLPETSLMFQRATRGLGVYGVQVYDFNMPLGSQLLTDEEAGLDPTVTPDDLSFKMDDTRGLENKKVAVFVLDVRSNRSPWRKTIPERFQVDTGGDMLGEEQWKWFEVALGRSQAAVNVVVTGLQVHAERFYDPNSVENWNGFPRAQHRLYQALLQPNVKAPILISGDVHHAQLSRKDCQHAHNPHRFRPLYEVTTSGMTHAWGHKVCGRVKHNPFCHSTYLQAMFRSILHLAHWISPWTELLVDKESKQLQYSLDLNIAELNFDWDHQTVITSIFGVEGRVLPQQEWTFQELTEIQTTSVDSNDFETRHEQLGVSGMLGSGDWVCVQHRGLPNRIHFAIGVGIPLVFALSLGTLPMWLSLFLCWKAIVLFKTRRRSQRPRTKSAKDKAS